MHDKSLDAPCRQAGRYSVMLWSLFGIANIQKKIILEIFLVFLFFKICIKFLVLHKFFMNLIYSEVFKSR
ncbi:MAG: hypothetical protein A2275_18405 [Bacteroidetes bacterium RIFOXYA12_FULL_35_11]|nr:MAG: hypothetical protein A2X01_11320 [Bacteroidetes bacterium GWF2_35_48]OFY82774.1 MAG: hypothetical protein A2275_18405 [Bacteroidetes bacterium RIFOXYA12_FULL_35_11]OFY94223.1 MAG: hypothetical protein A2309_10250 [Bacteroidetes bacterium RIFOXYB2_FULL_35_7]OFZ01058.1 MAG: hypothetical protein A2491_17540 [Bacteroidetes bacterium RIFOXYC12_FULL_35_7]HBX51351.1 hypothetical protein [Bacteroidales bacterium]